MSIERAFYCNSLPGLFCKGQFDYKYDLFWVQDISLWCALDEETWFNDSHHSLSSFIRGSCSWSNGLLRLTIIFKLRYLMVRVILLCSRQPEYHNIATMHGIQTCIHSGAQNTCPTVIEVYRQTLTCQSNI